MSGLNKYLFPIIVGNQPLGNSLHAYKMDSTSGQSDMRKDVGLGTCNSCDYFRIDNECVHLIEETKIIGTIKNLKSKFSMLDINMRDKLIHKFIRDENRMKVYGSMLILCKLAAKCKCVASKLRDKPVKFFLVVGTISGEDARYFDDLGDRLHHDLKSMLTAEIVADVAILNSDQLKAKLLSSSK